MLTKYIWINVPGDSTVKIVSQPHMKYGTLVSIWQIKVTKGIFTSLA
jgi:hypothetical protein